MIRKSKFLKNELQRINFIGHFLLSEIKLAQMPFIGHNRLEVWLYQGKLQVPTLHKLISQRKMHYAYN